MEKGLGKFKRLAIILSLVVFSIVLIGCGSEPAEEKPSGPSPEQQKIKAVVDTLEPMIIEAEDLAEALTKTVQRFGYGEANKETTVKEINKILDATISLHSKVDGLELDEQYDEIKGNLATSLYLREPHMKKLLELMKQENPKSSELNKILAELDANQGFMNIAKGKLRIEKQKL